MTTATRDTFKYRLYRGGRVVFVGVTSDPDRRMREHQVRFPDAELEVVGKPVSRKAALDWERIERRRQGLAARRVITNKPSQ